MRRATTFSMLASERLPAKVRGGALRLLGACIAIWVLGLFSPEIDTHTATIVLIAGWGLIAAIALVLAIGTRRVVQRLDVPVLGAGVARVTGLVLALRKVGIVLLALAFFLFWTLIYIGVWRANPAAAFKGLSKPPTFSEFFYYAVSTGFISPPGDITAYSKGARTATMIELLTGTAALAAYIGSFIDFGPAAARAVVSGDDTPNEPPAL
jgi:hypothetical protein